MANLKELKQFKDEGIITEDEFGEMKEKYIKSLLTSDEEKIKEQK
jgi:hypothetical protein